VGFISEETIQKVTEASDIVEVIGSYFPLKRAGTSYRAVCPFHNEKTPSFHVNPERQAYHCFGCGAGGKVIRFVMDYEHLDFPSAVRRLAQRAGIPVVEVDGGSEDDKTYGLRKRLLGIHAEAAAWFHQNLLKSPAAQVARDYLKGRGITAEVAKSWQLGYAPDSWDALLLMLREKGFSNDEIAQSGLSSSREDDNGSRAKTYARFRDRVMFPIRNDYGEAIAFSGRVLDPEAKTAKYVNSPETPLFTKGKVLYALDKSKRALIEAEAAVVCEGQLDTISAFEHGVKNVIAPQGTAFTGDQARLLSRFVGTVFLCFDSDRAGQEAVTKSLPALLDCGLNVKVVRLPEGEDPDSLIRGKGPDAFREAIAQAKDFFDHALDMLEKRTPFSDPNASAAAAKRLSPYLAMITNPILRETWTNKVAQRLGITGAMLSAQLQAAPSAKTTSPEPAEERQRPVIKLSEGIATLCCLALSDPDSREWLASRTEAKPTDLDDHGYLLERILAADFIPGDSASQAIFFSRLAPEEEQVLAALDLRRNTENPLTEAKTRWNNMVALGLQKRVQWLKTRVREPGIAGADRSELQKQILDLTKRLNDLFRPLPEESH
jgi:DNA primase